MVNILDLTLNELRQNLLKKKIGVEEVINESINASEKNRNLNIYITETFNSAKEKAKISQKKIDNNLGGPLEGIPLGIKDVFCTNGVRTTAGSKILENFIPQYESTVTQKLFEAGGIMIGKTNMDEFAMGSANITSYFGPVESPIRSTLDPEKKLVPGGSSGGSASSVAAKIVMAATASDTGGSIRQPASFCGLVGLKPTYGLCSRYGIIALASSLDQPGPITKTVRDAAIMLTVMAGYDKKDSTSINIHTPNYLKELIPSVKNLKIGFPRECLEGLSEEVLKMFNKSIETLKLIGAEVFEISLPLIKYALPAYYIINPAEASSNLARFDGVRFGARSKKGETLEEMYEFSREEGFGMEVKRRIMIGTHVLSSSSYEECYLKAKKVAFAIMNDYTNAFDKVDLIITPSATGGAFGILDGPKMSPIEMYLNDIFTVPLNLAGIPGISVNAGYTNGMLPLGLQFIGPKLSEQLLLDASAAFEDANELFFG